MSSTRRASHTNELTRRASHTSELTRRASITNELTRRASHTCELTRRANVQTIHIRYTYIVAGFLCSDRSHNINANVWPTSRRFATEQLHKFQLSRNEVTLNEGQGYSRWNQNVEFNHVYHHAKFERNRFISVRTQANLNHVPHNITY